MINSILEKYNKIIKNQLDSKRVCNWPIFIQFIKNEINRIIEILAKNEDINVIYQLKFSKFNDSK